MTEPIIVLKFGGSVLQSAETLPLVVHEIYRWRRSGFAVVAVVSALAGTTDALLEETRRISTRASSEVVAALVSSGEWEAAGRLGVALDRAGVTCAIRSASALHLRAEGDPLDSNPLSLDCGRLRAALRDCGVVVLPGYIAESAAGDQVLLGRGGSDLTALFIAQRLGAACRLVKDVAGLYEWDPAEQGPAPRRFVAADYSDALGTDGSVIQHKAIRFARDQGLTFELGAWGEDSATRIGRCAAQLEKECVPPSPWRVSILGLGTVGEGVRQLLEGMPGRFQIQEAAVRRVDRRSQCRFAVDGDPIAVASRATDVVVEAMGGLDPALPAISAALQRGIPVVSANKAVLAAHGPALEATAQQHQTRLLGSAAVGGAVPCLEHVGAVPPGAEITDLQAVLNGTSNFVLDRLEAGASWDTAVCEAQEAGLAERDPQRDLSGQDAADKLVLLHHRLTGRWITGEDVRCVPLEEFRAKRGSGSAARVIRQVARLTRDGDRWQASVLPTALTPDHPLARLRNEENGMVISSGARWWVVRGKGAGRWPTAEAVVADLLELQRRWSRESKAERLRSIPRRPNESRRLKLP